MNDHFERDLQDGTPTYLWTVDTLDQDDALAMTPEEFRAEMKRLQIRAQRRSRRPMHRSALKAGAARLAPRLRGTDEPDLSELADDEPPVPLWHYSHDRHDAESTAIAYGCRGSLNPVRARAMGIYLDLVWVGEIPRPLLDCELIRILLTSYVACNTRVPAVQGLRNTSTTMARIFQAVADAAGAA